MKIVWQHISDGLTTMNSGEMLRQYGSPIGRFLFTTRSAGVVIPAFADNVVIDDCLFENCSGFALEIKGQSSDRTMSNCRFIGGYTAIHITS